MLRIPREGRFLQKTPLQKVALRRIFLHLLLPFLFASLSSHRPDSKYYLQQCHKIMNTWAIGLHSADKVFLTKGKWLTDNIINAAQRLLKTTHSHIGGLQDTLLGETLSFEIQHGEFVQILNVSQSHWITVSNVGCKKRVVNIYDSIPSCYVPTRTKEQIAAILFANETTLTLEHKAIQVQQGSNDCSLFTIAFATSLCGGENPVEINYKQHLLRSHLLNCVTKQEIFVFPQINKEKKGNQKLRNGNIWVVLPM